MKKKEAITGETVEKVAKLSRLELSEKELRLYEKQLAAILGFINKLSELETTNTSPTSHPLSGLKNVFREDRIRKSLSSEEALKNAPSKKESLFSVPKIIE